MDFSKFRNELKGMFFSRRQDVFLELKKIACEDSGINVAWPDVLLFIDNSDVDRVISKVKAKFERNDDE